jgi:TolB protein
MGMVLFSLILVTALGVLHWALLGSQRQQTQTRAAFLAQQQLEWFVGQSEPQSGQGVFQEQDYRWSLEVKPAGDFLTLKMKVIGPRGASFTLVTERRKQVRSLAYCSQNSLYRSLEELPEATLVAEHIGGEYSLSPDGQQVAFTASHQGRRQIFLKKLNSQEPETLLFEHPQGASEPAFSPDGRALAFTSWENGLSQVFVYTFATRAWMNRSRNSHQEGSPSWFPDGKSLLICRDTSTIIQRSVRGSEQVLVAASEGWNAAPSTDGKGLLVFMSSRDGNPEIYLLDLRSKRLTRLTDHPAYDTSPHIKGPRILFQSNRDGQARLYSMNLDGSEVTPLTPDQVAESPQWVP